MDFHDKLKSDKNLSDYQVLAYLKRNTVKNKYVFYLTYPVSVFVLSKYDNFFYKICSCKNYDQFSHMLEANEVQILDSGSKSLGLRPSISKLRSLGRQVLKTWSRILEIED
jgi:hypothetical protein